ncbi:hypothetical protein BS47DRAFT_1403482 [Hydnum rufescens UP504]|uniref:Uncharacterized protein n=1 Tax=Hydnum rufescens UP504 TaxID=1448309 RepID=A0A9P6AB25_9AGAM|nr:hypothetical protein BS47DRAFT_1403482 [Hydnum rufescens UP504]
MADLVKKCTEALELWLNLRMSLRGPVPAAPLNQDVVKTRHELKSVGVRDAPATNKVVDWN